MNRKLLSLLIIPLLATALFFIVQAFPLLTHFGFSSVAEEIPVNFDDYKKIGAQLLKNEKITGTFKATANNLGVVLVRFVKFGKGEDTLEFRLRRKAEDKWYYTSKYYGHQFESNQYYPFGFPALLKSKDNTYVFEIVSLSGHSQNGVGVSENEPQAAFVYSYRVGEFKNPQLFLSFVSKKSLYVIKNTNYALLGSIFVLLTLLVLFAKKNNITFARTIRFFLLLKKNLRKILLKYI